MAPRFFVFLLLAIGCSPESPPPFSDYEPADVYFPKEKRNLHAIPSLSFKFCDDEVPFDRCPVLSDCAYPVADLEAAAAKVEDRAFKSEFERLVNEGFQSAHRSEAFLAPFCALLGDVRKEEACKPKNACTPHLKKR